MFRFAIFCSILAYMRKLTCKQMGGICDVSFKEDSAREVMEQGLKHFKDSYDAKHKELFQRITEMNPEERKEWNEQFQKAWNEAVEE